MERKKCIINGCNNLATLHYQNKQGEKKYHAWCSSHKRDKYPSKSKVCFYCGFSLQIALHKHHLKHGEIGDRGHCITLCANCHHILHRLFQSQRLKEMSRQEVYNHLDVVYKQYQSKEVSLFPDMVLNRFESHQNTN